MTNQTHPPVRLKGVGDSLWVTLDPTLPVDNIKVDLKKLFERLKHLAINARVIIDTGDDEHESLVTDLGEYLKDSFDVGMVSGPPRKTPASEGRGRSNDMKRSWENYRSDVLMLAGRVRSGQKVTARKHLVIMGDVNPGAEVLAGGDIMVMGALCGTAIAGQPDNEAAMILALDFRPSQVQIGGIVAAGTPSSSGEGAAEFAHVENGNIIVDDYLKAKPFAKLPWPEVR